MVRSNTESVTVWRLTSVTERIYGSWRASESIGATQSGDDMFWSNTTSVPTERFDPQLAKFVCLGQHLPGQRGSSAKVSCVQLHEDGSRLPYMLRQVLLFRWKNAESETKVELYEPPRPVPSMLALPAPLPPALGAPPLALPAIWPAPNPHPVQRAHVVQSRGLNLQRQYLRCCQ